MFSPWLLAFGWGRIGELHPGSSLHMPRVHVSAKDNVTCMTRRAIRARRTDGYARVVPSLQALVLGQQKSPLKVEHEEEGGCQPN